MKTITMTNRDIYLKAKTLKDMLTTETHYFPARVNYLLLKNYYALIDIVQIIEESKNTILKHYGNQVSADEISIPPEHLQQANAELEDMLSISQTLSIIPIKISMLDNLSFTPVQMEALFFMIEED